MYLSGHSTCHSNGQSWRQEKPKRSCWVCFTAFEGNYYLPITNTIWIGSSINLCPHSLSEPDSVWVWVWVWVSVSFYLLTNDWFSPFLPLVLSFWQYNDNNGNPYSDVFWLAALIQSVGELEFGQQVCVIDVVASP